MCNQAKIKIGAALLATLLSCTHSQNEGVEELSSQGKCEAAAQELAASGNGSGDMINDAKRAGGSVASYGLATAGYTADVVVTGTVGIVAITVFCPLFIAEIAACVAAKGACHFEGQGDVCFSDPIPSKAVPGLGHRAYDGTESWRQDDAAAQFSQELRKIAACYEHRKTREDLIKATLQLQQIHVSHIYDRAGPDERHAVDADIARVAATLDKVDPNYKADLEKRKQELARSIFKSQKPAIWQDPQTGEFWRFQPAPVADGAQATAVCEGASATEKQAWQIPTKAAAERAVHHGLADPNRNAAFAAARAQKSQAFVTGSEAFYILDLNTGTLTKAKAQSNLPLLCVN